MEKIIAHKLFRACFYWLGVVVAGYFFTPSGWCQTTAFTLAGFGTGSANTTYTYFGTATAPTDPEWGAVPLYSGASGDIGALFQLSNGDPNLYFVIWDSSGNMLYEMTVDSLGSPSSILSFYRVNGANPEGSFVLTGGQAGQNYTNGVYILGGTNSVLVINNPTQPIPVTLGGLDTAQEYFMQGLIYGSTLAAILLGFISVRRALSMGDAWND